MSRDPSRLAPEQGLAAARPEPRGRRKSRPSWLMLGWLTVVWVLLWGDLSVANVLAGLVIAVLVTTLTPLPRVPFAGKVRPWGVVRLFAKFAYDVVVASVQISAVALSARRPRGAVIRVRLRAHSDVFLYLTSGFTSLVPGSIVVEAHRITGTLYVHVFDVDIQGGLEAAERAILAQEERILRAFASDEQLVDAGYVPGARPRRGRAPGEADGAAAGRGERS